MKNIEINPLNVDYTKPISHYSKLYNLSINALRNRFKKLGIYQNFIYVNTNILQLKSKCIKENYEKTPTKCKNCLIILPFNKRKNKYCSLKCSSFDVQKNGGNCKWSDKDKQRLRELSKKNPYFNGQINWHRKLNRASKVKKEISSCKECHKEFLLKRKTQICCSRKCFSLWCKKTGYLKGKSGGFREGAGRSKSGWYKGIYCNSSYELAWVIWSIDHNINFKRNLNGFTYKNSLDNQSTYFPDFFLTEENTYVEIKGYKEKEFYNKISSFKEKLIVLDKEQIKPYINYVISKYGKNFIELYDGNPHKIKNKICMICKNPCKNIYCSRKCAGIGLIQNNLKCGRLVR